MSEYVDKRYEFVFFFEVENSNPNGDPDAGNMPRIDPETGHGLVTDVCLKRKVRNYVELVQDGKERYDIYVRERAVLNSLNMEAYTKQGIPQEKKKLPKDKEQAGAVTGYMCNRFYDIRAFGAVMTTEVNCGQVRGPIQFAFAKSLDPIFPKEISITRMAVTNEKDAEKERTMGNKHIVPYAVYRAEGYVSAALAEKTGFTQEDLEIFWDSLLNLFEHDRSAARGKMATRKLVIFEHDNKLGCAPAFKLFDAVKARRLIPDIPVRAYDHYDITIDETAIPSGVRFFERG